MVMFRHVGEICWSVFGRPRARLVVIAGSARVPSPASRKRRKPSRGDSANARRAVIFIGGMQSSLALTMTMIAGTPRVVPGRRARLGTTDAVTAAVALRRRFGSRSRPVARLAATATL